MSSIQIASATVTLTGTGSTNGYITVADNSPIFPKARGWLTDGTKSNYCIVTDLIGSTQIGLRFISASGAADYSYGRSDCSGYLATSTFNQETQVCEVEEPISLKFGDPGGGVTKIKAGTNITISPTSGVGTVTINSTGGGGGGGSVNSVTAGTNQGVSVDNTDPTNPIINGVLATTSNQGMLAAADKVKLNALSGTNTGDQTITLTSDVTGTGTGSFSTTIAIGAVTLAKMANLAANSIIGNSTGSAATPTALTTLPASLFPALTGDVTTSAGSLVTAISGLALSKLATQADQTVVGNGSGGVAVPVALTVSAANGLVATATTLTNTVLTGVAGGQTWIGGTASGNGITLSTTSNSTKGKLTIGSSTGFVFDEQNGNLLFGNPGTVSGTLHIKKSVAGGFLPFYGTNSNTGTTSYTAFALSGTDNGLPPYLDTLLLSSGYTTNGRYVAGARVDRSLGSTNANYLWQIQQASGNFYWLTGGGVGTERMGLSNAGNLSIGTGLLTTATDQFLYLNSSAGVPTGVPTAISNVIPTQVDRTNNKLNIYSNANWLATNRNSKGPDIASASTITPTQTFDYYQVTGTTTINYITTTGFENGNIVEFYFVSALTLTNNAGSVPANTSALQLTGAVDASMGAGSKIRLRLDNALSKWLEVSRSAA